MTDFGSVVMPSPRTDYIELARSKQGKLYKKQILHMGDFEHPTAPGKKVHVTKDFAKKLVDNFHAGYCDIVQVPIVNASNQHVEDPLRNLGEVVDLDYDDKGVYAVIDARKAEYADELGKTLIGASAMMHLDYQDTKTGEKVGPTLLHVAVTNRPYITNLDGFTALSADSTGEAPLLLSAAEESEDLKMDKAALIAALRDEHGIDVEALQLSASEQPPAVDQAELINALAGVLREAGAVSLSASEDEDEELELGDVAAAVIELSQEKLALAETVAELKAESDALKLSAAEKEVDELVQVGRILPAQRDAMLELKMSNQEMFDRLVPEKPVVALAATGVDTHEAPDSEKYESEVARLAEIANTTGRRPRSK